MNRFTKIIAMLAVALTSTIFTANAKVPFLMYGVSAGANVSNVKISTDMGDELKKNNQFGYQVGGMVGLDLPIVELTAEALWVHNTMTATIGKKSADIVCNTVECPVLVSLPVLGLFRVKAGPSFNIPVNATAKYSGDNNTESLGAIKSTVGYAMGVGVKLFNVTLDVRYNGQFKDKQTFMGIEAVGSKYDIKANSFSASLGYRF